VFRTIKAVKNQDYLLMIAKWLVFKFQIRWNKKAFKRKYSHKFLAY
jgi:hypothetical protein